MSVTRMVPPKRDRFVRLTLVLPVRPPGETTAFSEKLATAWTAGSSLAKLVAPSKLSTVAPAGGDVQVPPVPRLMPGRGVGVTVGVGVVVGVGGGVGVVLGWALLWVSGWR